MMKYYYTILMLIAIFFGDNKITPAQTNKGKLAPPKKCKVSGNVGGKYKFLFSSRNSTTESKALSVFVVIKSPNINKQFLLDFVKRIRQEYCNEPNILVEIFDDRKYAGTFAVTYYLINKVADVGYRGEYILYKDIALEGLRFSTKRGSPIDEITIELKDGELVNSHK